MQRFQRPALIAAFAAMATLQLKGCVEDADLALADEIAWGTHAYCALPLQLRTELRQVVDANAKPHKIRVECAADAL
ncbi:hypothetical protein ACM74C_08100 [Pseudomonas aeruginosa]|nr:hypothetical protein [Pseudomonas aeruginosa]